MNISDDGRTIRLKKDVVKNVAIVFLAIMLILTFFSNSIMNKSLPEVATEVIQGGTITEKIRGTGIVEADDPYSVIVNETRVIASVAVKEGDEVTKGQVLFYLEDEESEELEKAEKELEDLIYNYTVGALTGEMSDQAYHNATTGNVAGMAQYEAQIEASKARVRAAQDTVDSIARQIAVLEGSDKGASEGDINQAKLELEEAQIVYDNARETYLEIKAVVDAGDGDVSGASNALDMAKLTLANAKQNYEDQQTKIATAIKASSVEVIDQFKNKSDKYKNVTDGDSIAAIIFGADGAIKDADALNDWKSIATYPDADYKAFTESYGEYTDAKADYSAKKEAYDQASAKAAEYKKAKSRLAGAEADYKQAKNRVDEIQTNITRLNNEQASDSAGNQQLLADLNLKKADAEMELAKAKEDQAQLLIDISKTLDLANQNSVIREQQEKVEKLRANATDATVVAPVDGVVLSLSKKAGESTTAAEALATIQIVGKPMRMNITVTAEQAKKVSVGDIAELQNAWYYDDGIKIVLTRIANDPDNPRKSKLLMFNIEGDVNNGESLNISIGQRSRDFEKVVPNSAIREDNRGKFIYIIEEKGTPFGNRYKAKRVDVEVLATDDVHTAISADIDSWSYVITTSNKPIEAGQQVRFSDR